MRDALRRIFSLLDFRDEHLAVYLALLERPNLPASRIAQYARLRRTHLYALLSNLIERGVAEEICTEGVRRFRVADPRALLRQLELRAAGIQEGQDALSKLLPALLQMIPKSSTAPRVRLFQGPEGVKDLHNIALFCRSKTIHACADFSTLFPESRCPELNRWLWNYGKRRARAGVWYYGIVNASPASDRAYKTRRAEKRKLKMLRNLPLTVEICIFDDSVAVCSTAEDMMGVLVESASIAESARFLHKALWDLLPDYEATRPTGGT